MKKISVMLILLASLVLLSNVASARCWRRVNRWGVVKVRCVSGGWWGRPGWHRCGRRCRRRARRWAWRHPVYRNSIRFTW